MNSKIRKKGRRRLSAGVALLMAGVLTGNGGLPALAEDMELIVEEAPPELVSTETTPEPEEVTAETGLTEAPPGAEAAGALPGAGGTVGSEASGALPGAEGIPGSEAGGALPGTGDISEPDSVGTLSESESAGAPAEPESAEVLPEIELLEIAVGAPTGTSEAGAAGEADISIEAAKGNIFYRPGNRGIWNPHTHRYDGATPGEWVYEDGGNEITVTNNGAGDISLILTYLPEEHQTGIQGSLADADGRAVQEIDIPAGGSETVYLLLAGEPGAELDHETIGNVAYQLAGEE